MRLLNYISFGFSQAYKEGKKERPPFSQDPEPVVEKPEIPDDLLCNICKDLLTDAVMIPCCGNSFCDECKLITSTYLNTDYLLLFNIVFFVCNRYSHVFVRV